MSLKTPAKHTQGHLLYPDLVDQINPKDPLLLLAKVIPWGVLEDEFASLYSKTGRPAKPIRLMVGLLLLKQIENLSDERVVEAWVRNPYYQSFCGMQSFQWKMPCDPSELVHFRKRIGENGVKKILSISVMLHGEAALESEVVIDTTVQEKNITFPTDTKLRNKAIIKLRKIAKEENIKLRRSYTLEMKELLCTIRFDKSRKNKNKVSKAKRRIKTIANTLLREVRRKLSNFALECHAENLKICEKVINQERSEKDKIYSIHEPHTKCIAKGKAHKKYEFGSKVGIAMTKETCIILGVENFSDNRHDSKTLEEILKQVTQNQGVEPKVALCDRGFRGIEKIGNTEICIPKPSEKGISKYFKEKKRKNFRRRSAIEPVIGHVKHDFRMAKNYLKGALGDVLNLFLAAAAFNFKKWMRKAAQALSFFLNFALASFLYWFISWLGYGSQEPAETK